MPRDRFADPSAAAPTDLRLVESVLESAKYAVHSGLHRPDKTGPGRGVTPAPDPSAKPLAAARCGKQFETWC